MQKLSTTNLPLLRYCLIFLLVSIPLYCFIYNPQKITSQIYTDILKDFLYIKYKLQFISLEDKNSYNKDIENTVLSDSEYKFDHAITQNMEKDTELKQLLEEISMFEKLQYNNTKILEWENRVLKILEKEMGKDSDCYKQFSAQTTQPGWRDPQHDFREIPIVDDIEQFYQQEYTDHLRESKEILQRC